MSADTTSHASSLRARLLVAGLALAAGSAPLCIDASALLRAQAPDAPAPPAPRLLGMVAALRYVAWVP